MALAVFVTATLATSAAQAARRVIKFKNTTGQMVDDLHIETKQGCTIDFTGTMPFNSERGTDGGSKHNLYGGEVPNNGEATVTITSPSNTIEISKWWWTLGGNALRDGERVGAIKGDDGGAVLAFYGPPAAGNGQVLVSIGDRKEVWQTQRGQLPDQSAMSFMMFLDTFMEGDFDLIHNVPVSPTQVVALGNLQGDPGVQIQVQLLQPDSGQTLDLCPIADRLQLAIEGPCPGPVVLVASGAPPFAPVAFIYGFNQGSAPVPNCFGLVVDLQNPVIIGNAPANAFGQAQLPGNAPPIACGRVLVQAVDISGCATSDVVALN